MPRGWMNGKINKVLFGFGKRSATACSGDENVPRHGGRLRTQTLDRTILPNARRYNGDIFRHSDDVESDKQHALAGQCRNEAERAASKSGQGRQGARDAAMLISTSLAVCAVVLSLSILTRLAQHAHMRQRRELCE
jgi:hypothetical protein